MTLVELTRYMNDKESAETYLIEQGILKPFEECPNNQCKRYNLLRRVKYKRYSCNRGWGVNRGSILEGLRVIITKILIAKKLFKNYTSVRVAVKPLGLANNSVYNIHFYSLCVS